MHRVISKSREGSYYYRIAAISAKLVAGGKVIFTCKQFMPREDSEYSVGPAGLEPATYGLKVRSSAN